MNSLEQILADQLKDLRGAIDQAQTPARNYTQQKQNKFYTPDCARFRLVVWFKDGRNCWYYSYDNCHFNKTVFSDEWNSLKKLIRLCEQSFKDQFKNAIIYVNVDPKKPTTGQYNYELIKWNINGQQKQNKAINFMKSNRVKDVLLDCEKLVTFGNKKID
jgi:hypothetical protein